MFFYFPGKYVKYLPHVGVSEILLLILPMKLSLIKKFVKTIVRNGIFVSKITKINDAKRK